MKEGRGWAGPTETGICRWLLLQNFPNWLHLKITWVSFVLIDSQSESRESQGTAGRHQRAHKEQVSLSVETYNILWGFSWVFKWTGNFLISWHTWSVGNRGVNRGSPSLLLGDMNYCLLVDGISCYSLGWLRTHYVDLVGLKLCVLVRGTGGKQISYPVKGKTDI